MKRDSFLLEKKRAVPGSVKHFSCLAMIIFWGVFMAGKGYADNIAPARDPGNLVPNSSFELGFKGWGDQWDDKTFYIDDKDAFHGKHSLKLVAPYQKYPYYQCSDVALYPDYNFIDKTEVYSKLLKLEPDKSYTLSLYLKSDQEQKVGIHLLTANWGDHGKEVTLSGDWKRYDLHIPKLSTSPFNMYQIRIDASFSKEKDSTVWIDAVQLEEGEMTEYAPAPGIELSLWSYRPSNIFHVGKPAVFSVGVTNNTAEKKVLPLNYKIVNFFNQVVKSGSLSLTMEPKGMVLEELPLNLGEVGYFKGMFEMPVEGIKEEVTFGVITPQSCKDIPYSSPFGNFSMPKRKFGWEMCDQIGMKWYRGGEGRYGDIEAGKYWGAIAGSSGYLFPGWEPGMTPEEERKAFLEHEAEYRKKIQDLLTTARGRFFYYEVWNEPYWTTTVDNYLLVHKAAYEAVKSVDPNIPVFGNVTGGPDGWRHMQYLEDFLAKGGLEYLDGISTHPYRTPFNAGPEESGMQEELKEINRIIYKYAGKKMPVWITEFNWQAVDGFKSENFPYTGGGQSPQFIVPENKGTAWMVRAHIYALSEGIERFQWHYLAPEGLAWWGAHWNMVRQDSTPRPMYVAYGVMSKILAQAKFQEEVPLGANIHGFLFKEKDTNIVVFWHSLQDFEKKGTLELTLSPKKITAIDIMGNKIVPQSKEGRTVLPLTSYPCYLLSTLPEEVLGKALREAIITGMGSVLTGRWTIQNIKKLKLEVTSKSQKKSKTSAKLVSYPGGWSFQEDELEFETPLPGETKELVFSADEYPVDLKKKYLLETSVGKPILLEGQLKYNLVAAEIEPKLISEKRLNPVTVDGDLNDWSGIKPAVYDQREDIWSIKTLKNNSPEWNGPEDLSAKIYSAWDQNFLYLAAEVTDDVMVEHHGDPNHSYLADSIQMVFDVLNDGQLQGKGRPDKYDFSYVAALVDGKPELWRSSLDQTYEKAHRDENGKLAIKRKGQNTIYEIAIPMKDLSPFVAAEGGVMSFNLIINDNDGNGRKGWLGLSGGIGEGIDLSQYGHLILTPQQVQGAE